MSEWANEARAALARPPTSALPRLRTEPTLASIESALKHLDILYGSTEQRPADLDDEILDELDAARADPTERSFVLGWLTRVVETELVWIPDTQSRRAATEHAAQILSGCTSALDDGDIVREFTFPLQDETGVPPHIQAVQNTTVPSPSCASFSSVPGARRSVSVCVRDASLPPSDAHSVQGAAQAADAVGVQTYASSVILCDLLVRCPSVWHQCLEVSSSPKSTWLSERAFQVMELGAGTGIVGMVAAHVVSHIFGQWTNACRPIVYVTDYHADVMKNLFYNVEHYLHVPEEQVDVQCMPLDWRALHDLVYPERAHGQSVACTPPAPQSISLLLVADPVYDPMHATWLIAAIMYLLALPDTDADARAHIVLPVRTAGRLAGLYATVDDALAAQDARHGFRLTKRQQMRLPRRPGLGRQDESEYIWMELAWRATA